MKETSCDTRTMLGVTAYDVFMSYHWRDHARVEPIAQWLTAHAGWRIFLDRWYLLPGQPWPQALEQAIGACNCMAVFVGPGELGPWQQREVNLGLDRQARERQFTVIPVLLPGAESALGFLAQNTWIDLRDSASEVTLLTALAAAVRGEPPGPATEARAQHARATFCPYRGLLPFREEDASFFYGRDVAIARVVDALDRRSFTAVVGASGSGKSSVVRAGLIPRLRHAREKVWEVATFVPGNRPVHALASALVPLLDPALPEVDLLDQIGKLDRAFADGSITLSDVVNRLLTKQPGTDRILLVVDQWEELYTLTLDQAARQRFIDLLLSAARASPLSVVMTLRGDFVGEALAYRPLADTLQDAQVNVGPMLRQGLQEPIVKPARQVGLSFEPGLAERILDDVGDEPGHLPLLEFVLRRLWELREGPLLLHAAYESMGRLDGAVADRAERIFERLSESEQIGLQRVFSLLARPNEGRDYTRRRAKLHDLPDSVAPLINRLADERLIVTGHVPGTVEITVEVSHEALIRHWHRLRDWLDRDREFLLWCQRLRPLIAEWRRNGEPDDMLLSGAFLTEAERWNGERPGDLTSDERTYVDRSILKRRRDDEADQERRRRELDQARALAETERRRAEEQQERISNEQRGNRRLKRALGGLAIATVGVTVIGGWAWYERQRASLAATRAQLALAANDFREGGVRIAAGNPEEALPFLAAAVRLNPANPAIGSALISALLQVRWPMFDLEHERIAGVAFSPDGTRLITASSDGTAIVWDAMTARPVATLRHDDSVNSVAFSTDGALVVTASEDGTARIWNAGSGEAVGIPLRHDEDDVTTAEFNRDASLVVTTSGHYARIWNAATGQAAAPALQHDLDVNTARFSPDGTLVVTASEDDTARIWSVRTGQAASAPLEHDGSVIVAAFDATGGRVLTATEDEARLWDPQSGKPTTSSLKPGGRIVAAMFSSDGRWVLTAGGQGVGTVWDASTGRPARGFGRPSPLTLALFSPDSTRIALGSPEGTVRLWGLDSRRDVGVLFRHEASVQSAVFSRDGRYLAAAPTRGAARIWDTRTWQIVATPLRHPADVMSAVLSTDGQHVVTTSRDNGARIWDVRTGRTSGSPLQHAGSITSAAFSFDGARIVTASEDRTARIWDARTGQMVGDPLTHDRAVWRAIFSPDGSLVVTDTLLDNTLRVWDVRTGQAVGMSMPHERPVRSMAFTSDGARILTTSGERYNDETASIWNARTGQLIKQFPPEGEGVSQWAFSNDGRLAASSTLNEKMGDVIEIRDVAAGTLVSPPFRLGASVTSPRLAFNADGSLLLTVTRDAVRVLDVRTGQPLGAPLQHGATTPILTATFSPDGARVLTVGDDRSARIWDARTGQPLGAPLRYENPIEAAAFSGDGKRVVVLPRLSKVAYVWESPGAAPEDGVLLAEAAEALSGYSVNDARALAADMHWANRVSSLAQKLADGSIGQSDGAAFLRWLLADPWTRTISHRSLITVPDFIVDQLRNCTTYGTADVSRAFAGHPLLQRNDELCSGSATTDTRPTVR